MEDPNHVRRWPASSGHRSKESDLESPPGPFGARNVHVVGNFGDNFPWV